MAIAFRAYADVINESAVSTTTIPVPAGTAAGDVLVATVATSAGGPIVPDEAGWTQLGSDFDAGNMRSALWWRFAGASEPASYSFTASGLGSSVGLAAAWSGCDQTTPVSDADLADTTADDTSLATTAVTVPADGWLVTLPLDRRNDAGLAQSWASSDVLDVRRGQNSGDGGSGSVFSGAIFDSDRPLTAGDHSRTITATRTWAQVLMWSVALTPAAEPTPDLAAPEVPQFLPGVPVGTVPDLFNSHIRDPLHALLAPPTFRARNTSGQTLTENTIQAVEWDTIDDDPYQGWDSSNPSRWIAPEGWPGWWVATATVSLSGTGASGLVLIPIISVNQGLINIGLEYEGQEAFVPTGAAAAPKIVSSAWWIYAAPGDVVELLLFYSDESGITAVDTTPGFETRLELVWDGI